MNTLRTNPDHNTASITAPETQPQAALHVNQGSLVGHSGFVLTVAILLLAALALLPSSKGWADRSVLEVPVIASYPVYQTVVRQEPREQCHIQQVAKSSTKGQSATPAILGTIIGGALGNAVGSKKSNQRVGAVVGGVLGYSIGKDVGRRHAQRHGDVRYEEREACSTVYERVEEERLTGYDVSYAYGGQTYKTRMRRDPGSTVRVRVQVEPI